MKLNEEIKLIENSWLARIVRLVRKTDNTAIVVGKSIHLSGVTKREFLSDPEWVQHELIHIAQYRKYGTFKFIILYLLESVRKGYRGNKFEVEAREKSKRSTDHLL